MNHQKTWETVFRKHRLYLVTSLHEDVMNWLTSFTLQHVDIQSDGTLICYGERGQESGEIQIIKSFRSINAHIKENNQNVLSIWSLIATANYGETKLEVHETKLLRDFFMNVYNAYRKDE